MSKMTPKQHSEAARQARSAKQPKKAAKPAVSEWFVRLRGPTEDLSSLTQIHAPHWAILLEDSQFYLRSSRFEGASDANVVLARAAELLQVINGAALLCIVDFRPIELCGEARRHRGDGISDIYIAVPPEQLSLRAGRPTVLLNGEPIASSEFSEIEDFLASAADEYVVEKALALYGSLRHTWRNLYLILELIEDALGGEKKLLAQQWATPKLKEFKRTANSWFALRSEARHSTEKWKPPADPMTLDDARVLIRQALRSWIDSREGA